MKVKVQRAVLKFRKKPSLSYFESSVEFGYGINSVKLLSALPGGDVMSPSRYWHIPIFMPAMPELQSFSQA